MGLLDQFKNLDDKTFEEIVKDSRLMIPQFAREYWTDYNIHDPGITFLELFAWLAEMQMYQLNRVTDNNYKKFLKLIGIIPYAAQPAKIGITFDMKSNKALGAKSDTKLEKGTEILTELDGKKITFETEEDINLLQSNLTSIITRSNSKVTDNTDANKEDDIYFAAFGEKGSIGSTLELGFDKPLPKKEIQITFNLFDEALPSSGTDGSEPSISVNVVWEYLSGGKWKKLTVKKDNTLALNRSGKIILDIQSDMDKKDEDEYWIRCRWEDGSYEISPLVNSIILNTVSAVQLKTINELENGNGDPDQKIELREKPVFAGSLKIFVGDSDAKENAWEEMEDFESSGPKDKHYLFNPEKGEIIFGNGLNGMIPLKSQKIRISYKTTLGQKGNILAGQKWKINKTGFGSIIGENFKPANGGQDAELIEHAKSRAKKDFRNPCRAITLEDYEKLALTIPGLRIARVKAVPGYNPEYPCIDIPGSITVVIVPYVRDEEAAPAPGKGFLQTVSSFLDERRLITADLHVVGPEYVKVSIACKVRIKKKSSANEVEKRVQAELKKFLDPLKGGQDGKGWPFGRAVYPSEIYQIVDNIEGVDYVSNVSLSAESEDGHSKKEGDILKISRIALVVSGKHNIEIIE